MATISKKEQVIDRVSKLLVQNFKDLDLGIQVADAQRVIETSGAERGQVVKGRQAGEKLALFKSDYLAYKQEIESELSSNETIFEADITKIVFKSPNRLRWWDESNTNYSMILSAEFLDNIGQFIDFAETSINIDPAKAKTVIQDQDIYELLSIQNTREDRIDNFYNEFLELIGQSPNFPDTDPTDGFIDQSWFDTEENVYQLQHDLTSQDDWQDLLSDANYYIPRLDSDSDGLPSIQSMRNTLDTFLDDIDEGSLMAEDIRPEYENISSGYLKIRNLNQAIIIRNQESDDVGLIGPDIDNPIWREYGFTITMWVKFLDKVNGGTLFNFGNPLRTENPYGFTLSTFISQNDGARRLRLLVLDNINATADAPGIYYDSHIGIPGHHKIEIGSNIEYEIELVEDVQHIEVPIDLQEWFFIVATYSPAQDETGFANGVHLWGEVPEYWNWNVFNTGTPGNSSSYTFISNSGLGNKCKIEIISKTDLLRARGYKA